MSIFPFPLPGSHRPLAASLWILVIVMSFVVTSQARAMDEGGSERIQAVAMIHPTEGNSVQGTVTFTQEKRGVYIQVQLTGLTPGKHGFHIHEFGDCTASDASSAGGHYNPESTAHGGPTSPERHVGDLGNIIADRSGRAMANFMDPVIALKGSHSIIGRAVVVHKGEDDLTSQPSGDAGPRVACGVIGFDKP